MASSMEWSPKPEPRAMFAAKIEVARYNPDAPGAKYEILPNIVCEQVQHREGASPPAARFRYILDNTARARGWPTQFETILRLHGNTEPASEGEAPPERAGRYVVKSDDRLVVVARDPAARDAPPTLLFDGFAQAPQVDVSGREQHVTFTASGAAVRCWDEPITTVWTRDADKPDSTDSDHRHLVRGRVVFNPGGSSRRSNANTVESTPGNSTGGESPMFIDPRSGDPFAADGAPAAWTLDQAARYLLDGHNWREEFVGNPDLDDLVDLLRRRRPKEGQETYDPDDDSTYTEEPILLMEYDATGKPWPEVLSAILEHYGFAMAFRTDVDDKGEPRARLEVYRKDGSGPYAPKEIPFQASGGVLDMARQAIGAMSVARDHLSAYNAVTTITAPTLYEASFVLAPLAANEGKVADMDGKYRIWVAAELPDEIIPLDGNRRYDVAGKADATPIDFAKLWWNPDVTRPRQRYPGRADLISRDKHGDRAKATLFVSTTYDGPINVIVDPEKVDDFRPVAPGHGWRLLKDRLGVVLTAADMDKWNIGLPEGKKAPEILKSMQKMFSHPDEEGVDPVFLMLTVVIEDSPGLSRYTMTRQGASPLKYRRERFVEVGDAHEELVHVSSSCLATFDLDQYDGKPRRDADDGERRVIVHQSDEEALDGHLSQLRRIHENPPIAGTITIPWITKAHQVGDQISGVAGRGLSFQTNIGAPASEAPRYPYVVGVDWGFGSGGQSTTLHLSDRRAEPIARWGANA